MQIITTDNKREEIIEDRNALDDLRHIADCSLDNLRDLGGNNLWLFPRKGNRYDDKIQDQVVLSISGNTITTGNIMGFVGYGDTELTIRSRFSNNDGNDWFMQYMLQKVFAINIFNLKHASSNEDSLDIAALMLPYFLQKALCQGVYREYTHKEYNDSRVRGAINVPLHISKNFPFRNGKIAYSTREYTYDNSITQLIRHTIEYIKARKASAASVLYSSAETQANINQIINATPTFRKGDLNKVMLSNSKPKIHPYYSEYRPLQKLCMQILKGQKVSYGASTDKIHGLLFDGAWLWEEYLNLTFSKAGYRHPENRTGTGKIHVFKNRRGFARYPDFIKEDVIADAKYKVLIKNSDELIYEDLSRDDLNQMISYLHITSSRTGIFVNPLSFRVMNPETGDFFPETAFCARVGELYGDGGEIFVIGMNVPQECASYKEFSDHMAANERVLLSRIQQIAPDIVRG